MTETVLKPINLNLPIHSLDAYISHVNQIPSLSNAEEYTLAHRLQKEGDLTAAKQLVLSHAKYVVRIARGYLGYGLPLGDLIQEGNIGLMKAVKRFDATMGVRLVTFAVHWIKSEIHDYILKNWRLVKIATTKAQRKLFFNLRKAKKSLTWFTTDEVNAVAQDLGVKPETVREMEMRLHGSDLSLDHDDDEDHPAPNIPHHFLEDQRANPAKLIENNQSLEKTTHALQHAMQTLDSRSQMILNARWLNEKKATLDELAMQFNVSAERIRQLEKNAMLKLKKALVVA